MSGPNPTGAFVGMLALLVALWLLAWVVISIGNAAPTGAV